MPRAKYIKAHIDGQPLDLESVDGVPVSISYKLEDVANFQTKESSTALSLKVPATTGNDKVGNTFHNPSVEDLTAGSVFRTFRDAIIEANGHEILLGKALLTSSEFDSKPLSYEYDFYGNNGDWIIPLKEATLYEFLKDISFLYTKEFIQSTWDFDGTDPAVPFVFAPVRYGLPMKDSADKSKTDYNMAADYMKPSLSVYWLLYRGFKSIGYKISSQFFDTSYFRKLVMPWTWGNFLFSDGSRQDNMDFLAKSKVNPQTGSISGVNNSPFIDLDVVNVSNQGAFDNQGVYSYDKPANEMKWTYPVDPRFDYGTIEAHFHLDIYITARATASAQVRYSVQWFKNGVKIDNGNDPNGNGTDLLNIIAPTLGKAEGKGNFHDYFAVNVDPGDIVSAKIWRQHGESTFGDISSGARIDAFEFEYFRIPTGGTINFEALTALQKHKFIDFVAGVLDAFNISPQTDPVNKVVYFEPQHDYSLTNDLSVRSGGYFNGNWLDWERKRDVSKKSKIDLFKSSERELLFKFKEDTSDGLLKKVQDRNLVTLCQSKYVFPERFKAGKKETENRFFSPVVHCELTQWIGLGSDPTASPQIVCLVPENIANTSRDEAQNTFAPKLCYYKGLVDHVGWVFDGDVLDEYPYMFSTNYQTGGENDPILSYCDERIGKTDPVIGKGLLRRFFLQRLAIMDNGQYLNTFFRLNNYDVTNWLHREHVICMGEKWELIEVNDYLPLKEESTNCLCRKWVPVSQKNSAAVFPSTNNITDNSGTNKFDVKYNQALCLRSDIPTKPSNETTTV